MNKSNNYLPAALHVVTILLLFAAVACNNSGSNNSLPEIEAVPYMETEGGRYGFFSASNGEILCSDEIKVDLGESISPVVNGVFRVQTTGGCQYYTNPKKPEKISGNRYMRGGFYTDNCIPVVTGQGKPISLVDIKGDEIAKLEESIVCVNSYFSDGLLLFKNQESKYGYMDNNGKIVIPAKFTYAQPFNEGVAVVSNTEDDKPVKEYFIIGTNGETEAELKFDNLDMSVPVFFDGVLVCGNRVIGKDGKLLFRTPSKWDYVSPYNGGYANYQEEGSFGVTDKKGEIVIKAKYDYPLTKMKNSFLAIKNVSESDEDFYYNIVFIDYKGEQIGEIEKVSNHIVLSDNLVAIYDNKGYYLCDGEGKQLNNDEYSFIPDYSAMFNNNSTFISALQPEGYDGGIVLCDWVYSDYLPADRVAADIFDGIDGEGGFDGIKLGEKLNDVKEDYTFSALYRDYSYKNVYEFKNEVKCGFNVSYNIRFNEYIADDSDYNYNAAVDGFIIIPDYTTGGKYTGVSEKMYSALAKRITGAGFTNYANGVEWEGYTLNFFYKEGSPYIVAISQDASVIVIETID